MMEQLREWYNGKISWKYSVQHDPMLLILLSSIETRVKLLSRIGGIDASEILHEIEDRRRRLEGTCRGGIAEEAAWTEAYRLEAMIALVVSPATLLAEIRLRLDEATAENVSATPRLRVAAAAAEARAMDQTKTPPELREGEEPTLRTLLLSILNEIHWTKQRKFYGRPIQKSATRRIVWAGIISFVFFILPYLVVYGFAYADPVVKVELFTGLPLYTALTAGLFGAYFSRLLFIQANVGKLSIGELKTARELTSIFLRGSVGMCGALIVFLFLRSGLIDGSLFPDFARLTLDDRSLPMIESTPGDLSTTTVAQLRSILPSQHLALLAIWCFLAGFSERLVPSILSSTEQQFDAAVKGTNT